MVGVVVVAVVEVPGQRAGVHGGERAVFGDDGAAATLGPGHAFRSHGVLPVKHRQEKHGFRSV